MSSSHFDAIDRLVDFGLSAAVAQRMVTSMNSAIDAMNIPGRQLGHMDTSAQGSGSSTKASRPGLSRSPS
jgi:hypothetical protein